MFTCSLASAADHEPMVGTAPTDARWLFVEEPGPWGAQPLAENRLPDPVKARLQGLDSMAVHLIRHHGRTAQRPPAVLAATVQVTPGGAASTRIHRVDLAGIEDLVDLDLDALFDGSLAGAREITDPLWLVCTNGKRDRCCSVTGRPVADVLAQHWPADTWECTHLGGHRFAATLLALPSAVVLGRLTPENTEAAARAVLGGGLAGLESGGAVTGLLRGRVGLSGPDQVLDLHLLAGGSREVEVVAEPGPLRAMSCGVDEESVPAKKTTRYRVVPRG